MKKKLFNAIFGAVVVLSFASCAEHRYYRQNHRHTDEYYHRHHQAPPPPGVDINIHN